MTYTAYSIISSFCWSLECARRARHRCSRLSLRSSGGFFFVCSFLSWCLYDSFFISWSSLGQVLCGVYWMSITLPNTSWTPVEKGQAPIHGEYVFKKTKSLQHTAWISVHNAPKCIVNMVKNRFRPHKRGLEHPYIQAPHTLGTPGRVAIAILCRTLRPNLPVGWHSLGKFRPRPGCPCSRTPPGLCLRGVIGRKCVIWLVHKAINLLYNWFIQLLMCHMIGSHSYECVIWLVHKASFSLDTVSYSYLLTRFKLMSHSKLFGLLNKLVLQNYYSFNALRNILTLQNYCSFNRLNMLALELPFKARQGASQEKRSCVCRSKKNPVTTKFISSPQYTKAGCQ